MTADASAPLASGCPNRGRRVFLCRLGLAATATALAGCEFSEIYEAQTQAGATLDFDVSQPDFAALATVGGKQVVKVGGADVLLLRASETQVLAFAPTCPHQGKPLLVRGKWDAGKQQLRCSLHSATFATDGSVVDWPKDSSTPRALKSFQVEFTNPIGKVTT